MSTGDARTSFLQSVANDLRDPYVVPRRLERTRKPEGAVATLKRPICNFKHKRELGVGPPMSRYAVLDKPAYKDVSTSTSNLNLRMVLPRPHIPDNDARLSQGP